jgi:glycine/D-amino acid oxidase-like deaminating enzyme
MRVIVVGGGVVGLLTAMECLRAGAQVALVDQSELPSPVATSHDRLRVIRTLHRGDAALTAAAARAHEGWLVAERRVGGGFYFQTGALTAMPADEVPHNLALLAAAGVAGHPRSPAELSTRYPRIRFPSGTGGVFDPAAGAVLADRALAALTHWLREQPGVRVYSRRRVVDIDDGGFLRLAEGTVLAADRVVVAAGPWSRDLLPATLAAELTLYRQSVLSYEPVPSRRAWAGIPAVLGLAGGAWLMPPAGDAPVRLSAPSACREVDGMSGRTTPDDWREHLVERFAALVDGFDPAAVIGATDGYYLADTATGGPVLATLGDGAVWAYAACGGMSFKFAPLVARNLAERVVGRRSPRPTGIAALDQPRGLVPSVKGMTLL